MNVQRWIALGLLVLLGVCIATSNLWSAPFWENQAGTTSTPQAEAAAGGDAVTPTPDEAVAAGAEGTVTVTLNPVIEEMMASMGEERAISNEPFVILAGDFTTIDAMHHGQGTASVYQVGDTRNILRLDPLNVTNGPDLHVLLSPHLSPRTSTEALGDALDLGALASNTAAQNFEIPEGTDLDRYQSVVIYSMSLNIVYTTATLEAVRGGQ
jgi:hypothetical protein